MGVSTREPGHGPQISAIFGSPSASTQPYRRYLIQSPCLPLRLMFYLTRPHICPFHIVSKMDQRSIVLYLHLKELSARAIHDDTVATLDPKAVASSTVIPYLREAKLGTIDLTLDPEPSSHHLTSTIPTGLSWRPWKKRKAVFVHARTCPSRPYLTCYRLQKAPKIARVHTMSSSLAAATSVRRSESEAC
jgi:hypothetical protein